MSETWLDQALRRATPASSLNLPPRYHGPMLSEIPEGALKTVTIAYLTDFYEVAPEGRGCLFLGRTRTWKTYATAVIADTIHKKTGLDCMFVQCGVLGNQIDRNRFAEATDDYINKICRTSLVVMDDFAQISERGPGAQALVEIAESRFSDLKPTLWTANVTPVHKSMIKAVANMYGAGFARRIFDTSENYRVQTL